MLHFPRSLQHVATHFFSKSPSKLAANNFGDFLKNRTQFQALLSEAKNSRSLSQPSLETLNTTGNVFRWSNNHEVFGVQSPFLLEKREIDLDVNDLTDIDEIRVRYNNIIPNGNWEKSPDGIWSLSVRDIALDVREAVTQIANEYGVHYHVSIFASGGGANFVDELPPVAHPDSFSPLGKTGYTGDVKISFAKDVESFGKCWSLAEARKRAKERMT
ncbi:hypothetical protein JW758_00420 [Candidatus Peregrinibacteria bacterium]|nr:hypothetical protein [Candidatus Peregrinibacteria bacterium]